jgi:hypothetical protein
MAFMNFWQLIRWILLVPATLLGWWLIVFLGILFYETTDLFCAKLDACQVPLLEFLQRLTIDFFAAVAAAVVVLIPALIAPNYSRLIARVAYMLGALYCFLVLFGFYALGYALGFMVLVLLCSRTKVLLFGLLMFTLFAFLVSVFLNWDGLQLLLAALSGGMLGLIILQKNYSLRLWQRIERIESVA